MTRTQRAFAPQPSDGRSLPRAPRPRGRVLRATLLAAALTGGARAHAQTLPLPVVPQEAPAAPAVVPTQFWEYDFELRGAYDTNVPFLPDGPEDFSLNPQAEVARVFRGPRSQFRAAGSARTFVYTSETAWNRTDAKAGLDGSRTLSSNATLSGQLSAELGHTDSNSLLDEQGVLLPLSRTRTLQAYGNLDWRLGTRSSLRVEGRAFATKFDAPLLVDSASQRGALSVVRRMTGRGSLSVHYSIERATSDVSYFTNFGSLQWQQVLSEHAALLLEGGTSYTDRAAASGLPSTWNFYGGAALTREVGRSRFMLFARREVTPAFGIGGLRLSDRFGVQATLFLGRNWLVALTGSHVDHRVPEGESPQASGDEGSLNLQRSIGRRFFLGAGAQYRRRGAAGSTPKIESFQGALVLGYSNLSGSRPGSS